MPEGPEVRRTVDLIKKINNKTLYKIKINNGRYVKHGPFKNYEILIKDLPLKIKKVDCKGKFIYIIFENDKVLFNTLGMSGRWNWNFDKNMEKHDNLTFYLKDYQKVLFFNDYRNFGTFMYCDMDELNKKLKSLGPDILMEHDKYNLFREKIEKKRNDAVIGTTLLDQKVASGCGNYLRAEVLYYCKISPYREIKKLTEKELKLIWSNMVKIAWIFYDFEKGIKNKIFTKNDKLLNIYLVENYLNYTYYRNFQVYNQETDGKGNKVISEKLKDRTIRWVKEIQK